MRLFIFAIYVLLAMPTALAGTPAEDSAIDLWQLLLEAEERDPRVLAGRARSDAGVSREREAFGQLLPQLGISSAFNRTSQQNDFASQAYDGERYALTLSQVIYDAESWHNYQRYRELARQQGAELKVTQEDAILDLVERYFKALAAEDELALVSAELRATERNLQQVKSLYKLQRVMVTDVLEISARVDALRAREIEVHNTVALSREALSEIIGREINQRLKRVGERVSFMPPGHEADYWVERAMADNAILKARSLAVDAAQAAVKQAQGGYKPRVSLSLTGQRSDIGYENSQAQVIDTYVASLGVQIPLYSGGAVRASVAASDSELTAAQHELEQARRYVLRETRSAYFAAVAGVSKISAGRNALASAEKASEAAERAFGFGVTHAVDVLNSIKEEYAARRALLQAQYDFILSSMLLQRWSGSLLRDDVRMINGWLEDGAPPG